MAAFVAPAAASLRCATRGRLSSPPTPPCRPRWVCASGRELTLGSPVAGAPSIAAWVAERSPNDPAGNANCGVLLLADTLGHRNEETREFAVSLADAGLTTLVPDLFRGDPWDPARPQAEYEAWRSGHPDERVAADVRAAASVLRGELGVTSLGMLGFCFGGGRLMDELAAREAGVNPATAVVFYPTRFDAHAAGKLATCSLMAVFGEKDKLVPRSVVEALQGGLDENDEMDECELMLFEKAGHAFAHHPKSAQDEDDCEILKHQTAEWFNKRLT